MAIVVKRGGSYDPIPEGSYRAVCYGIVDLGTQESTFNGQVSYKKQIQLFFELPDEVIEIDGEEKVRTKFQKYTASLSSKATLYKHLRGWLGNVVDDEGFNIVDEVLGQSCLIQITNTEASNGNTYDNIDGIVSLPKGMPAAEAENEFLVFDFDDENALAVLDTLPEYLQGLITSSPEYIQTFGEAPQKPQQTRNVERDTKSQQQRRPAPEQPSRRTVGATSSRQPAKQNEAVQRRNVTRQPAGRGANTPTTDVF